MRLIGLVLVLAVTGCAAPEPPPSTELDSPSPSSEPAPPDGISRDEAVDVALGALPDQAWRVVRADAGRLGQVRPDWAQTDWGRDLSADLRVWNVVLRSGDVSAGVVLDFVDGAVYDTIVGIAN